MSLRLIDLNLVPVLQLLLRERSISRTAQLLGLTQPAVSAALRRIRTTLGDQLLIRVGGQMELTPRGLELIGPLETACENLEGLFMRPIFEPENAALTFVVAAPDQASFLIAPKWLDILARTAPQVKIQFVDLNEKFVDRLAAREVDLGLIPAFFLEDLPPASLHYRPLFRDYSVVMFNRDHPLAALGRVTPADLAPFKMISFYPSAALGLQRRSKILLGGHTFEAAVSVPQMTLPPFLLLDTDYVTITSRRMAERMMAVLPLTFREMANPTPEIEIGLAWSPIQDEVPAHRWFRSMAENSMRQGV